MKYYTLIIGTCFLTGIGVVAADSSLAARWDFDGKDPLKLVSHGGVKAGEAGPASPEFPLFPNGNRAVQLKGNGARLMLPDTEGQSFQIPQG